MLIVKERLQYTETLEDIEMTDKEINYFVKNILNMTTEKCYDYFIRTCIDHFQVWAIEMNGGYVSFKDSEGDEIFPVYTDYDLTKALMFEDYKIQGAKPIRMSLKGFIEKCIPDMTSLKIYFGIICNENSYQAVPGPILSKDLRLALDSYNDESEIPRY